MYYIVFITNKTICNKIRYNKIADVSYVPGKILALKKRDIEKVEVDVYPFSLI